MVREDAWREVFEGLGSAHAIATGTSTRAFENVCLRDRCQRSRDTGEEFRPDSHMLLAAQAMTNCDPESKWENRTGRAPPTHTESSRGETGARQKGWMLVAAGCIPDAGGTFGGQAPSRDH